MQRLKDKSTIMVATAIGLIFLGGMSYTDAAEETKKPAEQATPPAASKAPAATPTKPPTSAPSFQCVGRMSRSTLSPRSWRIAARATPGWVLVRPAGPAPKYNSAETAAQGQACFGEAPKIESVMPDEGKAGDKVTISGRNFGPAECLRSLSFGPGYPATFKLDSPTQIIAAVPSGKRKGLAMLTVTTASGEDSKVFVVK